MNAPARLDTYTFPAQLMSLIVSCCNRRKALRPNDLALYYLHFDYHFDCQVDCHLRCRAQQLRRALIATFAAK
jgi:hypothetical protein